MPMRRGADAKVKINGNEYAVQRFRFTVRAPNVRVDNTEGYPGRGFPAFQYIGWASNIPDNSSGSVELVNASFDDNNNPFATPISFVIGTFYKLELYPAGGSTIFWQGAGLLIDIDQSGSVPGAQPISAKFEFDGAVLFPTG